MVGLQPFKPSGAKPSAASPQTPRKPAPAPQQQPQEPGASQADLLALRTVIAGLQAQIQAIELQAQASTIEPIILLREALAELRYVASYATFGPANGRAKLQQKWTSLIDRIQAYVTQALAKPEGQP
jgi:hypothetical protein